MDTPLQVVSVSQFIIAVTASALAIFVGTVVVELLKDASSASKQRGALKTLLVIELEQLGKLIDRIKIEHKARKFYPIGFLNLGLTELSRIEDNLKASTVLQDMELQKKLFETTTDCRALLTEILGNEQFVIEQGISSEEKTQRTGYVNSQRSGNSTDLSDAANRLSDLIRDLKR